MKFPITKAEFRAFVEGRKVLGNAGAGIYCPLAQAIRAKLKIKDNMAVFVDSTEVEIDSGPTESDAPIKRYKNPSWATKFVKGYDDKGTRNNTKANKELALSLL